MNITDITCLQVKNGLDTKYTVTSDIEWTIEQLSSTLSRWRLSMSFCKLTQCANAHNSVLPKPQTSLVSTTAACIVAFHISCHGVIYNSTLWYLYNVTVWASDLCNLSIKNNSSYGTNFSLIFIVGWLNLTRAQCHMFHKKSTRIFPRTVEITIRIGTLPKINLKNGIFNPNGSDMFRSRVK